MKAKYQIIIFLILLISISCVQNKHKQEWSVIFNKYNTHGTFVLKSLSDNQLKIYNMPRSDSAYLPASTFKILNSMIALQTSAVKSINDTIKWDGIDRGWKPWNKDQTMKTALPVSCIWFYQELARRIGTKKMQKWVDKADYGNKDIGKEIDSFWLEGNLRISAKEQIMFLEKLINNELQFDKNIQETVKEIMVTDSSKNYIIHSKTGLTQHIGWNVGYVEKGNNKWVFAMNIDASEKEDARFRKKITYEILRTERIIK